MKNFIGNGQSIDIAAGEALTAGQFYRKTKLLTFASINAKSGQKFAGQTRGVFNAPKDASAFAVGDPIYYDEIADLLTASDDGLYFGVCIEDAASGDNTVKTLYCAAVMASRLTPDVSDVVLVRKKEDLAGTLDSTKLYRIVGQVDMEDQPIIWPEGGLFLSGPNGGRDVAVLYSSADNYTMFVSPDGGYSGNLILDNCSFNVTGTGSKIFGATNAGNNSAIDITTVNFGLGFGNKCKSLGELTGFRQIFTNGVGFFIEDGLTMSGTWAGGATIRDSIVLGFPASATFLKEGTSLLIGTVRSNINFNSVDATSVLCDFAEANITQDAGFNLEDATTTADDPLPNLSHRSVKARIRNSYGFKQTYIGGEATVSAEVETVISAVDTPVPVLGTWTYKNLTHFSGDNSNEFVSESDQVKDIVVEAGVSVSGGANDQVNLFWRLTRADLTVEDGEKFQRTLNGGLTGTRAEGYDVRAFFESVGKGDKIVLMGENITDSSNFTVLQGGLIDVQIRPN